MQSRPRASPLSISECLARSIDLSATRRATAHGRSPDGPTGRGGNRAPICGSAENRRGHAGCHLREAFQQVVPIAVPTTFDDPPSGWRWRKLTEIARLESGHTPSRSRPDWWGGDVSWISLTEIRALRRTVGRKHATTNERSGHREFGSAHPAARDSLLLTHGLGGLCGHHGEADGNQPGLRELGCGVVN